MSDRESFLAEISGLQHAAESAFSRGDPRQRLAFWSHREPVSVFAALGPSKSGWNELGPMFESVATRLSEGHDVEYEVTTFDVGEDIAWTAGFLRLIGRVDAGPVGPIVLRITHVYRREDGAWRIVHEHSNFEPVD